MRKSTISRVACLYMVMLLLVSCGWQESKTAEEWFDFTWSGLAGIDSLKFKGQAAVARGERWNLDEQVGYSGELKDHQKLSMQSTLPSTEAGQDKEQQIEAAGTSQARIQLAWNGETWKVADSQVSALTAGLSRFNPLEQMESIRRSAKTITEEHAAARGTRVLRIQLDPEAAKKALNKQLVKEMEAVRTGWQRRLETLSGIQRKETESELEREWSKGRKHLDNMLAACQAETVYYLTINRNTGLPERMTSETRLLYTNTRGIQEQEALLTDSKFEYGK
ncbi:hypothetical protein J41TS12_35490 [Paenibacillus antibioticophila]|uniref:Lipoprotein n=1 Tax=Paenibacillus antibioticophila TaxID=1274374 RepID=A0A919XY64_9BACL|nr:hypothetical protein [Paenibacillus antibioticophila]GIO38688.1 hypothetical protein J41TS12_35490 [Paenibacillus antibioticophila]